MASESINPKSCKRYLIIKEECIFDFNKNYKLSKNNS